MWFGTDNGYPIFMGMLVTSIASALSAITEKYFGGRSFELAGYRKSYLGSAVFFVSVILVFAMFARKFLYVLEILGVPSGAFLYFGASVLVISIILTVLAALSFKEVDKLLLPVFGTLLILIFFSSSGVTALTGFAIGMAAALAVAVISYRLKFLTADGSAATFVLAAFLFGLGGIKWSVPIMAFFLLSSILSKIRKKKNEEVEMYFEKTGTRDYMQVIANGGLGGILVILNSLYPAEVFYLIYTATLAAVCADTWATEIGTLNKTGTYNILNLKPITQGTSGGISVIGSVGAFLGAFIISLSAVFWVEYNLIYYFFIVIFAGTAGSFFDSFLGATIQAQNKCAVCEKITEKDIHCGEKAGHFRGIIWMNNDLVNLLCGLAGGLIIIIINGL